MMDIKEIIAKKGYIDEATPKGEKLLKEIDRIREEKNAIILAHVYERDEIQDIADFVGDSLALSQQAAKTDANIIVFAGVNFMAETAKILSPDKKVLLPDINAGCSLADSCPADKFEKFIKENPGRTVITYVNTTAAVKALSDIICTSSNAVQIVRSLPENKKLIFAPDRNLGNYVKAITGRDMLIWNGTCHVHKRFSLERILQLKKQNPTAKIIAHPECEKPVRIVADYIGSTSQLIKFTVNDYAKIYIVATEPGVIHQMKLKRPDKVFIPGPPYDSTCGCSECEFMKLITLEKIYNTLKYEQPEILLDKYLLQRAKKPILRMMEITEQLAM